MPANRIETCFNALREDDRCALVTYIMAGDPSVETTIEMMHGLVASGADIIELGMPFSDPMADGPVIQRASERAMANGVGLSTVLDVVRQFRESDTATPIVLMGYLNPIEAMGYERFVENASNAGIDGVLIVDLPPEEAESLNALLAARNLEQIFLIAPNTDPRRVAQVCEYARGFVYYVSVKGVTGQKTIDAQEVGARIAAFREHLKLPIGVGFGIKSAESAAAVATLGEAVIVGSAIIERIEQNADETKAMHESINSFVAELRVALDQARAA